MKKTLIHLFAAFCGLAAWAEPEDLATEAYADWKDQLATNAVCAKLEPKIADKIDLPKPWIPVDYVPTKTSNGVEWCEQKGGGGGGSLGPIAYIKDDAGNKYLVKAEVNPAGQIVASIEQNPTNFVPMTVEQEKNRALLAEGILNDQITNEVARAQLVEEDLDERIKSMSAVGRFLSTWDCTAGKPGTEPKTSPMAYKAGDYYIVASVETGSITNYIPSGTVYTNGSVSTAFTTNAVSVNDLFRHTDDGGWVHVSMSGVSTTFGQIAGEPRDNMKLANELDKAGRTVTFDVTKVGSDWTSSLAFAEISNIVAVGKQPLARIRWGDGTNPEMLYICPFSYTNPTNCESMLFTGVNYKGAEDPGDILSIEISENAGLTSVEVFHDSVSDYRAKKIIVGNITNAVSREGSVTLANAATTNDVYDVKTNLIEKITNEVSRAYTVETNLLDMIEAETNRAYVAETNLLDMIEAETNRAYIAETNIVAGLVAETNRAYTVETNLLDMIEAETNRAFTVETNIVAELVAETNRAYIVETNLLDMIEIETNRAYVAETNLLDMIEAETNRAYVAETNLLDMIESETNRAYVAETNILDIIESETNRAYVAETNIVAELVAETNRAYTVETNLQAHIESATNNVPRIIIGNSSIYADRRYKDILAPSWTPSQTEIPENPDPTSEYYKNVRFFGGGWKCDKYDYSLGYWRLSVVVSMIGDNMNPNATVLQFPDNDATETRFVSESVDTLLATTNEVGEVKKIADDEITRATAAEENLEQLWEDEADLRLQADNDLWAAHETETNRAQVAEAAIAADLQAEVTRSTQADEAIYTIATNKQDKLPPVVNDKYLHVNAVSGNLEWSAAGGGGGGGVEAGGKNLYVDPPTGSDSREAIRLDNLSKGYTVGHYKATLSTSESPTGAAEIGYYTITDLGDNDCYMEGRMKNGYGYWCKRKSGAWSVWSRQQYVTSLNGTATDGKLISFYAPTASGTSGQVLKSSGSGYAPTWNTPANYWGGTKVTLNGTDCGASTASFYAPTGAGTQRNVLRSNGSGAPSWGNPLTFSRIFNGTIGKSETGTLSESYANFLYLIVMMRNANGHYTHMVVYNPGAYTTTTSDLQMSTDSGYVVFHFPSTTSCKVTNTGDSCCIKMIYGAR